MDFKVSPSPFRSGSVTVPGDKSISHRALMLGSIAKGRTEVTGFLNGEDCLATAAAMRALGVEVREMSATDLVIEGVGLHGLRAPDGPLNLGNSGTAMRLMAGLLAGQAFDTVLTGDASLSGRPSAAGQQTTPHLFVPEGLKDINKFVSDGAGNFTHLGIQGKRVFQVKTFFGLS